MDYIRLHCTRAQLRALSAAADLVADHLRGHSCAPRSANEIVKIAWEQDHPDSAWTPNPKRPALIALHRDLTPQIGIALTRSADDLFRKWYGLYANTFVPQRRAGIYRAAWAVYKKMIATESYQNL